MNCCVLIPKRNSVYVHKYASVCAFRQECFAQEPKEVGLCMHLTSFVSPSPSVPLSVEFRAIIPPCFAPFENTVE